MRPTLAPLCGLLVVWHDASASTTTQAADIKAALEKLAKP